MTPRQRLRQSLQENADVVSRWPAEVREAISTARVFRPRQLSLKEVLAGCDRAAARVAKWPKWKRDL